MTTRLPISCGVQLSTEGWEQFGALLVRAALTAVTGWIRSDTPQPAEWTILPEERVWNPACYHSLRSSLTDVVKGPIVKALGAEVRYAVIESLRTEGGSERFVLAYGNEQSLRDLIATPCIAALGFSSREDAAARIKPSTPIPIIQKQAPRKTVVKRTEEFQPGRRGEPRLGECSASSTVRRFLAAFYGDVVAAGILIFFSRNIFSTAIRTFLTV